MNFHFVRFIPLSQDKFAVIDAEDFALISNYNWHYDNKYATTTIYTQQKKKKLYLHKLLMPGNAIIDHRDGNTLNNRKRNLRTATRQQNGANASIRASNKSGYKGVVGLTDKPRKKRWAAYIKVNYKAIFLGVFATKEEAAIAYNKAAIRYFGEFARINVLPDVFIDELV